jgi:quercetin 2,3-dioxygenase
MRNVKQIIKSSKVDMGGIIINQPLPNQKFENVDPFLLIHHWDDKLPGEQKQNQVGVGPHPHRGFSPVTIIFKGNLQHRDSRGNNSIVKAGGTQWMFAGRGIVHSERPAKELAEGGGEFEVIQFWINIPAKDKMGQPEYFPLPEDETPYYFTDDKLVKVGIISGEFLGTKGAIQHVSPLTVLRFDFKENGEIKFNIPATFNLLIYILNGSIEINGKEKAGDKQLILFDNNEEEVQLKAEKETRAILLAGKPLNEKIVSYGPFIMNSETQIMEALRDAQMGKMGVLIEEFD